METVTKVSVNLTHRQCAGLDNTEKTPDHCTKLQLCGIKWFYTEHWIWLFLQLGVIVLLELTEGATDSEGYSNCIGITQVRTK